MLNLLQGFGGRKWGKDRDLSGEKIIFFIITIRASKGKERGD